MTVDPTTTMRVSPGSSVSLESRSTDDHCGWTKEQAVADLEVVKARLDLLQQRLAAEGERSVLLVLQAMDAAGKDGTVRSITSGMNPAGVQVTSFKAPGGPEVRHDYLWRVHAALPARGEIGIFNRSHYEDVLVVRVKGLAPKSVWSKRYRQINDFERMLTDEGTTIVKCFLHVSNEEQRRRLQERVDDPEKRWKFRSADLDDRRLWTKYQQAYERAIEETSTKWAPWHVVPADHNWARNLAVATILLRALERVDPRIPRVHDATAGIVVR
ncbi:MAG: polyphosphate kinase 2 family protein [Actinomycetota bacterium]